MGQDVIYGVGLGTPPHMCTSLSNALHDAGDEDAWGQFIQEMQPNIVDGCNRQFMHSMLAPLDEEACQLPSRVEGYPSISLSLSCNIIAIGPGIDTGARGLHRQTGPQL